jgi:hypothetical protein
VRNNCFYQLHQLLQYHVLADSKPLACLMLSLEHVYPPAHQLALDMSLKQQSDPLKYIILICYEAENTNFIVFGLSRQGLGPMIYRT